MDLEPLPEDIADQECFETAASETIGAEVARLLIAAGTEPNAFSNRVLGDLTGASLIQDQRITPAILEAQKHRRFGTRNPEPVAYEFWLEMVRSGMSGHYAHERFGQGERDYRAPAIWSFDRFGMSTTELPDNVWVQIAGEHEDYYDADFCIYNDVIVHDGAGNTQIYIYPREVFPPTDFHTATLVENAIIIIGSIGYPEDRRIGRTQVMRLNLKDLSIKEMETTGRTPGWIGRHQTKLDGDKITVWGGQVWDGSDLIPMDRAYELCLATGVWQKMRLE